MRRLVPLTQTVRLSRGQHINYSHSFHALKGEQ
jgi:hypothetical protein